MVYAEKVVTAIQRGTVNTRWRDFADIHLLCRHLPTNGAAVHEAGSSRLMVVSTA